MPDRGQRDGALFALASDLPGERPAEVEHMADQSNVRSHNLPAQLTPLVGRDHEVAAACALLRQPDVRLLTLTGTGGVGKTRLGLQIATELIGDGIDGVCFVQLASISDPELVVPTIAQILGIKEIAERPLLDLLVRVTPPPTFQPHHPLQLLVTNLSANDYVGRMAVGRLWNGATCYWLS